MDRFEKILQDIKKVKIQGARNIALAGIKAFLLKNDKISAERILRTRPTEPLMQNAIRFLQKHKEQKDFKKAARKFVDYVKYSDKEISEQGASLVEEDMNIFTHCHSSSVVNILKYAKRKLKKNFVVYTTETDPLLQGRKTAKELARTGIKIIHVPDTAAEYSLKKADLFLFGSDAFLKKGSVNKVGTAMYAEIAKYNGIPVYCCGISLKYTKKVKLEFRSGKEVWDEREKNISVLNPAFDVVKKKFITGVVSEFGILNYPRFIHIAKNHLKKWV